jgi:hypothetical protein
MRHMRHERPFLLALIAIATLASSPACGSSGDDRARQATEPTATETLSTTQPQEFVSTRYDFRVTLTKDWTEHDAQIDWDGKKLQGIDSPAFTNIDDPATGRTLVAAAAPVAPGTQLADWQVAMVAAAPSFCSNSSATETTLDGAPALAWSGVCGDGFDVIKVAALHGERGYMLFMPSKSANDNAEDRRIFTSVRQSFRFTS